MGHPGAGMRPTHLILPHLARFARSDMGHPFTRRTERTKIRSGPPGQTRFRTVLAGACHAGLQFVKIGVELVR